MKTLEEMAAAVSKDIKKEKHQELILEMETKLNLIQLVITEGPKRLEIAELTGISFLISDIQKNLTIIESFCEKAEDYFYFLDNPGTLTEVAQVKRQVAEV